MTYGRAQLCRQMQITDKDTPAITSAAKAFGRPRQYGAADEDDLVQVVDRNIRDVQHTAFVGA
jgi:hypothetical protein